MENPTTTASFSKIPLNQLTDFVHLKLKEDNFITWKNLMNPVIQKYKLRRYLDGSHPCPPQFTSPRNEANGVENTLYLEWIDEDSTIIMWINSTISDVVIAYFSRSTTSHPSMKKGDKSIPALVNEIKSLSDQLAAAGEVIYDKELVVVTLKALNSDYIPFSTAMRHRNPPVTCIELHNNLLSEETFISERHKTTHDTSDTKAFVAHNGNYKSGNYRGGSSYRGRGRSPLANLSVMLAATNIFDAEEWIADSGSNNHITSFTTQLHDITSYDGVEEIQTANGADFLVVPQSSHNLLSIHKFTTDNNCSLTLDSDGFAVKDLTSGKTLFQEPHKNCLYPISFNTQPHAFTLLPLIMLSFTEDLDIPNFRHFKDFVVNSNCLMFQINHSSVMTAKFADDFTKYCWVLPLSSKSDFKHSFVSFVAKIENMFSVSVVP
ncbi:uncharacterized protein LOC113360439 [Papaver somniferum]|uniref:uncharacterized protein LOC113360439 n=1 Tax=Papaver somniferum TaxID=3469 RepID=UPI000E70371C|nr:uncharacterized protein LOC113360439 [Papaver somniferum]